MITRRVSGAWMCTSESCLCLGVPINSLAWRGPHSLLSVLEGIRALWPGLSLCGSKRRSTVQTQDCTWVEGGVSASVHGLWKAASEFQNPCLTQASTAQHPGRSEECDFLHKGGWPGKLGIIPSFSLKVSKWGRETKNVCVQHIANGKGEHQFHF